MWPVNRFKCFQLDSFVEPARRIEQQHCFQNMNHPGILITILFLAVLSGSIALVGALKNNGGRAGGYVCPPCGCSQHDLIHDTPGVCTGCGMPLITVERTHSKSWEALFESAETNFYHHKFFYPVNFLALFIGILALFRFKNELPTVLFFVFFGSLVLYSFKNQLYGTAYSMHASRKWAFFPISFLLATGPALYLYFKKILTGENDLTGNDRLHFLPAAVVFLLNAGAFFGFENWRQLAMYNNYDHFPGLAEQLTFIGSSAYYSFLIGALFRNSEYPDPRFQKWQRQLRIFLAIVTIGLTVMILGNLFYFDLMSTWLDYHPVWLFIAVFTLWSIYVLVFRKEVIFQKSPVKESRWPDVKILLWKDALETVMHHQRPYLNPDLSLQMLAQMVGIKEKDLSEVLNIGLGKSFHDYINLYRIEEVKRLLLNPEKQHLTNFAMAQEAGFNSKSAFFGLFKKHLGMTPGAFKRKNESATIPLSFHPNPDICPMNAIRETNFQLPGQTAFYRGKVRDVYSVQRGDAELLVMVASDRISAFDHILPRPIPCKGAVLNQIAAHFLNATRDICPNWLLDTPDPNVAIGHRCEPVRVEMVIRGYLAGHAARTYASGLRTLCGVALPDGLRENDRFPTPIITPTTKADEGHDEDISREEILHRGIVSREDYEEMEAYTRALFRRGTEMAARQGLILVDTKYEFGKKDGRILLMDEIHTPDSSRYFYADGYAERQARGEKQRQLSKEFVREWLIANGFQGKEGQAMPEMPDAFVQEITDRYVELYEKVTGKAFVKDESTDLPGRIERNILSALPAMP